MGRKKKSKNEKFKHLTITLEPETYAHAQIICKNENLSAYLGKQIEKRYKKIQKQQNQPTTTATDAVFNAYPDVNMSIKQPPWTL